MSVSALFFFVYARTNSARLPAKCFFPFNGTSLILHLFQKINKLNLGEPVLLTSTSSIDDFLVDHVTNAGFRVFRGHPSDLVARTSDAIRYFQADAFIRVNGDSPFWSPHLCRIFINNMLASQFTSNLFRRTFPYGVSLEFCNSDFYKYASDFAQPFELEHVTKHIYRLTPFSELNFRSTIQSITSSSDDSNISLVVDTYSDYYDLLSHQCFEEYWTINSNLAPKFVSSIIY